VIDFAMTVSVDATFNHVVGRASAFSLRPSDDVIPT
jgi:hypothetical protein